MNRCDKHRQLRSSKLSSIVTQHTAWLPSQQLRLFVTEALEAARGAACAEPCGAAGTPARSGPACAPCTAGGSSGCGGREVSAFPRAAADPAPAALCVRRGAASGCGSGQ